MTETKLHDAESTADTLHNAAAAGRKALEEGYDNLREYGEKSLSYAGRLTEDVVEFVKREDGPTAVEYAVMLALIIVVCIAAITTLGSNLIDVSGGVNNPSAFVNGVNGDQVGTTANPIKPGFTALTTGARHGNARWVRESIHHVDVSLALNSSSPAT